MRTRVLSSILMVGVLPIVSFAGGDVGYRLKTGRLEVEEVAETSEAAPMKFVDRAWTTPGVEESTTRIAEAEVIEVEVIELEFDFPTYIEDTEESPYNVPRFFHDFTWPRTRETIRNLAQPEYFVFGGINLSR